MYDLHMDTGNVSLPAAAASPQPCEEVSPWQAIAGNEPLAGLYRAVIRYLESVDGSAVVIGGVQIQEYGNGEFYVAIKVTGTTPRFVRDMQGERMLPAAGKDGGN